MKRLRPHLGAAVATALVAVLTSCGATDEPAGSPSAAAHTTPQGAYDAVVAAYVNDDCDAASDLVDGTEEGVDQFLSGCEERENLEMVRSLEPATGTTAQTSLDPLPPGVTEAVRLTAAYTADDGTATDYFPDMVKIEGSWKLWLPGD